MEEVGSPRAQWSRCGKRELSRRSELPLTVLHESAEYEQGLSVETNLCQISHSSVAVGSCLEMLSLQRCHQRLSLIVEAFEGTWGLFRQGIGRDEG